MSHYSSWLGRRKWDFCAFKHIKGELCERNAYCCLRDAIECKFIFSHQRRLRLVGTDGAYKLHATPHNHQTESLLYFLLSSPVYGVANFLYGSGETSYKVHTASNIEFYFYNEAFLERLLCVWGGGTVVQQMGPVNHMTLEKLLLGQGLAI